MAGSLLVGSFLSIALLGPSGSPRLPLFVKAALIQGPPVINGGGGSGGRTYRGPGDTAPSGGSGSSSPSSPAPVSPATPSPGPTAHAPPPGGSAPRPPSLPTPVNLTTESDDDWWLWWEYNKIEFLLPNRHGMWGLPVTGAAETSFEIRTASVRRELEPLLVGALRHSDGIVRAAAAISVARALGDRAIDPLLSLLDDPNTLVRERAILALGVTGSPRAVLPLLSIARRGSLDPERGERILPAGSGLAIVALGLGRRHGFDARIDGEIAELAADRERRDHDIVATAALMYHVLSPCPELAAFAARISEDEGETPGVRCRAVESQRSASDDKTLARLQRHLSGRRMDLRRSAALALGEFRHPLALPSLVTAFELEAEPLTRGLVLVSIGRQGGEVARDFLLRVMREEGAPMRRWSALALGILSRAAGDDSVCKAIREAGARERHGEAVGAYWIASGLARDEAARSSIREGLTRAADPRQRMYAATALALIGGDPAASALETRITLESSPLVRVAIAGAIGALGRTEQAPALLRVLQGLREPDLEALAACALAIHGSWEALQALAETARIEEGPAVRRAAAVEGIGMMLGSFPPLSLGTVSRQANYTVFTDWVKGMLQTTL